MIRKQTVNMTQNWLRPEFYTSLLSYHTDRVSNNAHNIYILILGLWKTQKAAFFFSDTLLAMSIAWSVTILAQRVTPVAQRVTHLAQSIHSSENAPAAQKIRRN